MCRSHYQIFTTINIPALVLLIWKVYGFMEWTEGHCVLDNNGVVETVHQVLLRWSFSCYFAIWPYTCVCVCVSVACPMLVRSVSTLECWPSLISHNGRNMLPSNRNLRHGPQWLLLIRPYLTLLPSPPSPLYYTTLSTLTLIEELSIVLGWQGKGNEKSSINGTERCQWCQ